MSEAMQIWMEIAFNVAYLIAVWVLVYLMAKRQPHLPAASPGRSPRATFWRSASIVRVPRLVL